jgi:hypothetical protein
MSRSTRRSKTCFRVLVPMWGESYIDKFCKLALPALLADGNLPAIARHTECEVIVLTTQESRRKIEQDGSLKPLGKVCAHSFISIDDLLTFDEYGVILTVAYGRGIASMRERQLDTCFIFLNADFVFSDGLLTTILDRLERGFNAVVAPSLRCIEEEVGWQLLQEVSVTRSKLSLYPSEMVRMALDHMHPTVSASIVNRSGKYSGVANQFFWHVDERTLLGRYFLMFMLCIRPEVPFAASTGWCDYSFIPELVPSGNLDILANSDDGFILELQARDSEASTILDGRSLGPEDYAPRLSYWTTEEHRRYASRDVVFRAGDWPTGLEEARTEFTHWMSELFGQLVKPATSHREHPFWVRSIDRQKKFFSAGLPPEFASAGRPRPLKLFDRLQHLLRRRLGQ